MCIFKHFVTDKLFIDFKCRAYRFHKGNVFCNCWAITFSIFQTSINLTIAKKELAIFFKGTAIQLNSPTLQDRNITGNLKIK